MRLLARLAEETIARDAIANGVFVAAASHLRCVDSTIRLS